MIYITFTNYKKWYERQDKLLSGILNYYSNKSSTTDSIDSIIRDIDEQDLKLYYTAFKEDVDFIVSREDLSAEEKLQRIQDYIKRMLS